MQTLTRKSRKHRSASQNEGVMQHMQVLCEKIGERHLGSEGESRTIEYLSQQFKEHGCEAILDPFDAPGWRYGKYSLKVDSKEFPCFPCFYSNSCDVSGPLLRLRRTELESLANFDVSGRICFVDAPTTVGAVQWRNKLAEDLDRMGAAAMIVVSNYEDTVNTKIVRSPNLASLAVAVVDKKTARRLAVRENRPCEMRIDARSFPTRSHNVIGRLPGCGKRKLAVCAHYDTAPGITAACDNASGVAVILECARAMSCIANRPPIDFIAFGGEEIAEPGPLGSSSYVRTHRAELENVACLVDVDTVGTTCGPMSLRFNGPDLLQQKIQAALHSSTLKVKSAPQDGDSSSFTGTGIPTLGFRTWPYEKVPIHSPKDSLKLIDADKLAMTLTIVNHLLIELFD